MRNQHLEDAKTESTYYYRGIEDVVGDEGLWDMDLRWPVVEPLLELRPEDEVLDIGCAKGFLLHDFKDKFPECAVAGVDVSVYAVDNAMPSVKPFLKVASAEMLPYPDKSFDLVISINSIHNLPLDRCKQALREMQRVSRGNSYVTIDAWRNEQERQNLLKWILTAEAYMHVDDWRKLFEQVGYTGDYYWFIAE